MRRDGTKGALRPGKANRAAGGGVPPKHHREQNSAASCRAFAGSYAGAGDSSFSG